MVKLFNVQSVTVSADQLISTPGLSWWPFKHPAGQSHIENTNWVDLACYYFLNICKPLCNTSPPRLLLSCCVWVSQCQIFCHRCFLLFCWLSWCKDSEVPGQSHNAKYKWLHMEITIFFWCLWSCLKWRLIHSKFIFDSECLLSATEVHAFFNMAWSTPCWLSLFLVQSISLQACASHNCNMAALLAVCLVYREKRQ